MKMINIGFPKDTRHIIEKKVYNNPANYYTGPNDVILDTVLNIQQKIQILKNWEFDSRELYAADDENMLGGPPNLLADILIALHKIDSDNKINNI